MDVDNRGKSPAVAEKRVNAEAGPSSQPDVPVVFLPPQTTLKRKPPIDSTQDLISRFQLLQSYDKYVRPYVQATAGSESVTANGGGQLHSDVHSAPTSGALDKGKGREIPPAASAMTIGAATPGADGGEGDDGEDEGQKGERKQKNSYKHLIKSIPGKHSIKKDDYLQTMMLVPPKQRIQISKLDPRTQREAFSVSLDGLKGWNINALVAESAQAREDRKKRKELKKLAKAQAQAAQAGIPLTTPLPMATVSASQTPGIRQPQTPASVGVGTPRPQGPGPGPPVHAATSGQTPGNGLPRSSTPIPRPGSRGRKREFEDDGPVAGKRPSMGTAGSKNSVPRPAKRPRTDGTPHQLGLPAMPQQQPTPQGV